jgi:hypothetical protein
MVLVVKHRQQPARWELASHRGGAVLIPAATVEDSDCRDGGKLFLLKNAD